MGQKVHPHGMRVGVIKSWDSRWYADDKDFGDTLVEDYNLRKTLKEYPYIKDGKNNAGNSEKSAGISKIEIERTAKRVRINIRCSKPGVVIGPKGETIDALRLKCEKMLGKSVSINVIEVANPDTDAQLVAENIAQQLEKRVSYRRAMKQAIGRAMKTDMRNDNRGNRGNRRNQKNAQQNVVADQPVKGIKTQCAGRLGGAEIARTEQYHEGTIPLQTIRADIDYGFAEANTTYGKIGVKVWIYKGEVLADNQKTRREGGAK